MDIEGKVAVITGAGSGIGRAVSLELVNRGVSSLALVDRCESAVQLATSINDFTNHHVHADSFVGDVADEGFRKHVFDWMCAERGMPRICVPAAGISCDRLAAKIDKESGKAALYPVDQFRHTVEVNLIAPTYWALEMVGRIAEHRHAQGIGRWESQEDIQGVVIFLGSVASHGNKGQIAYAATKAGLDGVASTLTLEAMFHGVRCSVIHPGFTDTPMVRALGEDFIHKYILPQTTLHRLIRPEEIADAVCFMISNSALNGELWADAGWRAAV
jgi:NAD(P)-dependent dehydrogenase (short-subunit alcohol dehydrogenase family)